MNGLCFYYDLVSGKNRTFFNANTVFQMEKDALGITYDSYYGVNKPLIFKLYISHVGNTSFTYTVDMYDFMTGIKYGSCISKVVYVNAKTRRPVKLPDNFIDGANLSIEKLNILPHSPEKTGLSNVPDTALSYKVKVLHSDCDRNLHVNQSTYVRWCADALYHHFRKCLSNKTDVDDGFHIENLTVQYIGEAVANENVFIYIWKTAEEVLFAIMNGSGKQIFNAKLRLIDKIELINDHKTAFNSKL